MRYLGKASIMCLTAACTLPASDGMTETITGSSHEFAELFTVDQQITLQESDAVVNVHPVFTVSGGALWIADAGEAQIRKYTTEGDLLLTLGNRGDGPGEHSSPVKVLPWGDDQLLIVDPSKPNPLSLWRIPGQSEPEFLGSVALDYAGRLNDARSFPDGRVLLASYLQVGAGGVRPLGIQVIDIEEATEEGVRAHAVALNVSTTIPDALRSAYTTAGWTALDTYDNVVAVAVSLKDSVSILDLMTGDVSTLVLPTDDFRHVPPLPTEAASDLSVRLAWMNSFSVISDLFFVSEDVLIVQFQDFDNQIPVHHLLGITLDGRPLFQIRNAPKLVAVDHESRRLLGYRSSDALPNELSWYTFNLPNVWDQWR